MNKENIALMLALLNGSPIAQKPKKKSVSKNYQEEKKKLKERKRAAYFAKHPEKKKD